ncbi:MAG: VanZ family protein [Candidatus Cloacimonetes bacterium]|nr:VanZ family protein [Candidatus Cloacimonadota bacterium]
MKSPKPSIVSETSASPTNTYAKVALFLFVVFLVWTITIANNGSGSTYFSFLKYIPGGDKTGHFVLMGSFCFLANCAIGKKVFNLFFAEILKGTLIVFLIVLFEECSQYFIKSRTFDLQDLGADILGIIVFDLLYRTLCYKKIIHNEITK